MSEKMSPMELGRRIQASEITLYDALREIPAILTSGDIETVPSDNHDPIKRAEEIAALRRRLEDIAIGINGGALDDPDKKGCELVSYLGIEDFGVFLEAVTSVFKLDAVVAFGPWKHDRLYVFAPRHLHAFATLDTAAAFLYRQGVRA